MSIQQPYSYQKDLITYFILVNDSSLELQAAQLHNTDGECPKPILIE